MPMPTTRRGRFLLYKARAIKRRNREYGRHPSLNPKSNAVTARQREWTLWGKQAPREFPRYAYGRPSDIPWLASASFTKPEREVFGVLPAFPYFSPIPPDNKHGREAFVGYQQRRVLSIPSARQRPWKPYLLPKHLLTFPMVNPRPYYHSGRPSYALQQGWVTI